MKQNGWKDFTPIDVVRLNDGTLITMDNRRLLAAHNAKVKVTAVVHDASEPLSLEMQSRFMRRKEVVPTTWGEAIIMRIENQGKLYKSANPQGSMITGHGGGPK